MNLKFAKMAAINNDLSGRGIGCSMGRTWVAHFLTGAAKCWYIKARENMNLAFILRKVKNEEPAAKGVAGRPRGVKHEVR